MTGWNYIVSILSVALLAMLLVREVRRENRQRLWWRIVATVLMIAALAGMALPIGYRRSMVGGNKEGVLLTEGYSSDSVMPKGPVWMDPLEIDVKGQALSKLHVYGYGLTREGLAQLPQVPLVFHPSPVRVGVAAVHWRSSLRPGEVCRIQGRFYNPKGTPVKLLLTGMHTVLDSAEIRSREEHDFELRTVPAQVGRAVYRLVVLAGADTLEQEAIPLEVQPGKSLQVLLLAAAPDFENRFLSSWLSERGHGVAVRTVISKGKYDHAYLNITPVSPDHLSSTLLDKFDIVIADAAELKAMGAGEYAVLRRQVAEKRLGLIIKADSTSLGHGVRSVGGSDSILRMVVTDKPGDRPLIKDTLSRTLVSANMYGAGKIILTTLSATYARLLAGNKKEYAALWTSILEQAAGTDVGGDSWQLNPALPVVDQPVRAVLQSGEAGLPQGLFEDGGETGAAPVVAYLAQRPLLSFSWEGLYWPRVAGWQTVRTSQGERAWWYVWGKEDWRTLRGLERVRETERWIAVMGEVRGKEKKGDVGEEGNREKKGNVGQEGNKEKKGNVGQEGNKEKKGNVGQEGNKEKNRDVGKERNREKKGDVGQEGNREKKGDVGQEGNKEKKGDIGKEGNRVIKGRLEKERNGNEHTTNGGEETAKEQIPKGWFCLFLVLSLLFLWVERKI